MKIKGVHQSRIKASRKRTSLSGAVKIAKNSDHTEFWQMVRPFVEKNDVDVKWLLANAGDKHTYKQVHVGEDADGKRIYENGEKREKWTAWGVQQIIIDHLKNLEA